MMQLQQVQLNSGNPPPQPLSVDITLFVHPLCFKKLLVGAALGKESLYQPVLVPGQSHTPMAL